MSTWFVAQLEIRDRERYSQYEAGFLEIFQQYDGRLVAVDEAPRVVEGDWPWTRTVMLEFPDDDAARRWYDSPEYQELVKHRHAASSGNAVLLTGIPSA